MNIIANRPNLLFLIAVRVPITYHKIVAIIPKLETNVFWCKIIKALSTYECINDNTYTTEKWLLNGILHRGTFPSEQVGPALIHHSDDMVFMEWNWMGKLHNEHGPAIMYIDCFENQNQEWYIHGKEETYEDRYSRIRQKYSYIK